MPVERSNHGSGASGKRRRAASRSPPCSTGFSAAVDVLAGASPGAPPRGPMFAALAVSAVVIEAILGYPRWLSRTIGHPVTWMGALIAWCDTAWNRPGHSWARRRGGGILALAAVLAATAAASGALTWLVEALLPWTAAACVLGAAASTLLAQRSLDEHVRAVAGALEAEGLEAGRRAVAEIVGRDTETLDAAGVSRAAIESLAENFSDG